MVRNRRKKRRGFWGWLMGAEPGDQAPAPPAPQEQDERESVPAGGRDEPPQVANDRPQRPCPLCGGTEFRWDWLESGLYGLGKGPTAAERHKWVKYKTRFGEFVGLRARLCKNCGHVDLFIPETE